MAHDLKISIGADPEIFLRKDGHFVSAHDVLPGTKINPFPVDAGAIQVDGVAAEFNIEPALSARHFVHYNKLVMAKLAEMAKGYELVMEPVAVFEEAYFHNLPKEVRELGCNPDFNAWTGQVNPKPDGEIGCMRTAAGHIHIGWGNDFDINDKTHFDDCRVIAKQLDYFLGVYSLEWDNDNRRRTMYGKAGSFRPKSYGMEYRPLSNVWLKSSNLQSWIFDAVYRGVHSLITQGVCLEDRFGDLAQKAIDNNEEWWKSSKHKLYNLNAHTGHHHPPIIEVPRPPIVKPTDTAPVVKRKAKHMYSTMAAQQLNQLINPAVTTGFLDESLN